MPATYAPGPRCNAPKYTTAFGACQALNTRYLARTATQPQHVGGLPVDIPWDELGTGWVLPGGVKKRPKRSPAYDLVEWERRTAAITGEKGQVIFEQKDVEVPRSWSQLAINVVAQKYFRGSPGSPERETSVRQIIDRVVDTIASWGREGGYFATEEDAQNWAEELRFLLVTQQA